MTFSHFVVMVVCLVCRGQKKKISHILSPLASSSLVMTVCKQVRQEMAHCCGCWTPFTLFCHLFFSKVVLSHARKYIIYQWTHKPFQRITTPHQGMTTPVEQLFSIAGSSKLPEIFPPPNRRVRIS